MEQAVNLFNEGLLSDTNPMILGNKTLTDCLNGTLVTMNGNEIALQNDMGNIRIDNAYLPSGYEPVGIKEYGGVIYIAAYNPITNKSQIGSFPSPERKINFEDNISSDSFDFDSFSSYNNKEESSDLGIIVLKNDSYLIPLADNKTLHVGDKFVVYSENLSELKEQISNYDNIAIFFNWKECTIEEYDKISDDNLKTIKYYKKENESSNWEECSLEEYNNIQNINLKTFKYCRKEYVHKVYSPKNKKYTLSLGILNEQNNFNDITSSLVRWNNVGSIIKDLEDKSDLYKFNVGYFIPDSFIKDKDVEGQTISDTKLISERKKIVANTFSYKLSGPLYLKVNYNHVSNFYCNITGKNIPENKIELTLAARFTYNCPDASENATYKADKGDDDYYTYEILENENGIDPDLIGFDFFINKNIKSPSKTIYKDFSYDKLNDVYYVTEELTIILESSDIPEDHILEYVIGVKSGLFHDTEISYIKGLSYKGTINTDLLNSGELNLTQYKFYNDSESKDSIMLLGFESYPKEGESFENLTLIFENVDDSKTTDLGFHYLYTKQPLINGQQIINFNFEKSLVDENGEEFPLQERSTYRVHIKYYHKGWDYHLSQDWQDWLMQYTLEHYEYPPKELQEEKGDEVRNKTYEETIDRWFLTTELFNDLYITNLSDYCNSELTDNNELFLEKLIIKPYIDINNVKVTYGSIKSLIKRDNDWIEAVYAVNLNENKLKLSQTVTAKIDSTTLYIDDKPYPTYIDFPEQITCNPEEDITSVEEEIEGDSYEQLSVVYWPVSGGGYKDLIGDKILGILVFADDATGSEDPLGITSALYDLSTQIIDPGVEKATFGKPFIGLDTGHTKFLYETFDKSDGDNHGWYFKSPYWSLTQHNIRQRNDEPFKMYINYDGNCDGDNNISTECLLGNDALNLSLTKVYLDTNTGHGEMFSSPLYIIKCSTTGWYCFLNFDIPLRDFEVIVSDKKENPNLFKIIKQTIPNIRTISNNFEILCEFSQTSNNNIPIIGNLTFDVSFEDKTLTVEYKYHNKQLIEYYMKYLHKTTDKYININTGNISSITSYSDFTDSDYFLYNSNGLLCLNTSKYVPQKQKVVVAYQADNTELFVNLYDTKNEQ